MKRYAGLSHRPCPISRRGAGAVRCGAPLAAMLLAVACAGLLPSQPGRAAQSDYPNKPIRVIVGFPPGGTADILARAVGQELTASWGQPVVLDNRPGAGSVIGSEIAAKATPDGYTLLVVTSSHVVGSIVSSKKVGYDPADSFTPLTRLASTSLALLGHPSLPVKTMRELLSYAKSNPGKLNFGSSGSGSTTHLAGEMLNSMADIRLVHVPYRGGAASMNDVISGHIQLVVISVPSAVPQVRAKRVIGFAVTAGERTALLPEVPTVAESGVPGYEALQWYAALAPAGVPDELGAKLNAELVRIVQTPNVRAFIAKIGAEPRTDTSAELRAYLRAEVAKWTKIAHQIGMGRK